MTKRPANFKWNYLCHALDGGFWFGGMACVAAESVLPPIIANLGGPAWLIAIIPQSFLVGFMLPTLLLAHWVEEQTRLKKAVLIFSMGMRIPYLIAGLALLYWGASRPFLTSLLVGLTPLLSGLCFGLIMTGWSELVSRTIPAQRRSSLMATRNLIGAGIAILAGLAIQETLKAYPGTTGYAYLHFMTFGFMVMSFIALCGIKEETHVHPEEHSALTFRENLHSLPGILKKDRSYRYYVLSRICGSSMWIGVPFFSLHVLETTGKPESFLGLLVSAQMLGSFVGNLAGGAVGDMTGGRNVLLLSRCCFLGSFGIIALASSNYGFLIGYFLMGAALNLNIIGHSTLMLEIPPDHKRPTYVGLAAFLNAPPMLLAGLIAWQMRALCTNLQPLIWLSMGGIALSLLCLWKIKEPRFRHLD